MKYSIIFMVFSIFLFFGCSSASDNNQEPLDKLTWELTPTMTATLYKGVLTISTTQESEDMPFNGDNTAFPWYNFHYFIISVNIEDGVSNVSMRSFYNYDNLTSVTMPNSVKTILDGAFSGCSNLSFVTISNSITTIGSDAFSNCRSLTSITIPHSVTKIWGHAFAGCSRITSVAIPNSVTMIGPNAFASCFNLKDVTVEWATPLNISYPTYAPYQEAVFGGVNVSFVTLHVPVGTKSLYEVAEVWKDFGKILEDL